MRRQTGETRPLLEGSGWSRAGTIVSVVLVILILIIAVPNLLRTRRVASGASPVSSLRTINTSETTYSATYNVGFSPTLAALGPPPEGAQPSPFRAGLIDSVLASGVKSGYRFTYVPGPPSEGGIITTYTVFMRPLKYDDTGRYSYFTDTSGVIRGTSEDRPATAKDQPIGG